MFNFLRTTSSGDGNTTKCRSPNKNWQNFEFIAARRQQNKLIKTKEIWHTQAKTIMGLLQHNKFAPHR